MDKYHDVQEKKCDEINNCNAVEACSGILKNEEKKVKLMMHNQIENIRNGIKNNKLCQILISMKTH